MFFFRPLDLTQEPASYAEATTVNLFYATNRLHDVFATNGFYAEAGNFQQNNYGATQGLAGDPLLAEDLDGGGFNNASMTVPPDGRRPRMQMRLFNYTTPARSSSLDNSLIVPRVCSWGLDASDRRPGQFVCIVYYSKRWHGRRLERFLCDAVHSVQL